MTDLVGKITPRIGTAAAWTSADPVLLNGELGMESNTGKWKKGDGSTVWSSLSYWDAPTLLAAHEAASDPHPGYLTPAEGNAAYDALGAATAAVATHAGLADPHPGYLTPTEGDAAYQPKDADLTTIAGLTATTDNFMVAVASAWASRTVAQVKATLALVKGDVGLGSVDNTSDAGKPVSTAQQTALDLKANLTSASLVTPSIGVATGTSLALTGALTSSGGAVGYAAGAGGTVSQATSKSTGVTLNKLCGTITLNGAALASAAIVTFTVTNSTVTATDVICIQHDSVGTTGAYTVMPNTSAAGSFKVSLRNNTAGSLSEAIVLRFAVMKAVAS